MSPVIAPTRSPIAPDAKKRSTRSGGAMVSASRKRIHGFCAAAAPVLRAWGGGALAGGGDDGDVGRGARDGAAVVGEDALVAALELEATQQGQRRLRGGAISREGHDDRHRRAGGRHRSTLAISPRGGPELGAMQETGPQQGRADEHEHRPPGR